MGMTNPDRKELTFDDVHDEDYDKEHQGKARKIEIEGNTIHIKCEDPYGFWHVTTAKGTVPDYLKSSFTSFDIALQKVNLWLKTKKEVYIPSRENAKTALVEEKKKQEASK